MQFVQNRHQQAMLRINRFDTYRKLVTPGDQRHSISPAEAPALEKSADEPGS
jgi:hypothetical protein